MCAESSHIGSGFGNYTKQVLSRLHKTGKYEIAELSCYRTPSTPKTEPWKVYPVAVNNNHPLYKEYATNDANQFGQWRFDLALLDFKPHIVFDIRDFWNFTYQETSPLRSFYHWMIAPTYDSSPPKIDTINSFYNADTLGFHTEWAKYDLVNNLHYTGKNISSIFSDAIDHDVFKPIQYSKAHHKNKYGLSDDLFIVGSVMRNQKRKLIPDLIATFAKFSEKNKNAILYLHTSYPDGLAWDLPALLLEYNIANRVLMTYICKQCGVYFPSVFKGAKSRCQKCGNQSALITSVRNPIDDKDLSNIYNLFDVYVQYAICEGFGIPPVEASACGVPVITINYGAMGEVGNNINASLININHIFREQETNADRIYPNNEELLSTLQKYIDMPIDDLNTIGKLGRKKCLLKYNWDYTSKAFEDLFDSIDISQKNDWSMPKRTTNNSHTAKNTHSHRALIYDIVDNIICEPMLKNTNFIEELIRNANDGFMQNGFRCIPFNKSSYIDILQAYLKNKVTIETLRTMTELKLPDVFNDFFEYSKK